MCTRIGCSRRSQCITMWNTVKPVLSGHSKRTQHFCFYYQISLNADQKYCRMLQREHSAILPAFINLPFSINMFVLSIFKWPLKTGFTVKVTCAASIDSYYSLSLIILCLISTWKIKRLWLLITCPVKTFCWLGGSQSWSESSLSNVFTVFAVNG